MRVPDKAVLTGMTGGVSAIVFEFAQSGTDEDKEAIEEMRRPYSTYALSKAHPGSHRDPRLRELQSKYSAYSSVKANASPISPDTEAGS